MGAGVAWPPVMVSGQAVTAGGTGPPDPDAWYGQLVAAVATLRPEPVAALPPAATPPPPPPRARRRRRRKKKRTAPVPSRDRVCIGDPWPALPAVAHRHAEAVERWETDCAAHMPPRRRRPGYRGTRTDYRPLFDGILDPDPYDLRGFRPPRLGEPFHPGARHGYRTNGAREP